MLAFTERDGPGRPPAGPSGRSTAILAGVLGVTFLGLLSSDTLCPDHRAWVQGLAGAAFLGICAAFVALWRGWAGGPLLTLAASLAGVGIGLIDAVHSPARGQLVALGFALATVLAAAMSLRAHRLGRWDAAALAAPAPATPAGPAATATAPAAPAAAAPAPAAAADAAEEASSRK